MSLGTVSVRVVSLVFIFITRLRFPSGLSIVEVLRKRYGTDLVKNVRKLEKIDYKYRKLQLDLDFLQSCQHSNVIPKFLRFKLANRNLRSSPAYNTCQKRLLKEEINIKKNKIKQYLLELNNVKKELQSKIGFVDFCHICTLFLNINNKKLSRAKSIQNKKLSNLVSENSNLISETSHNPEKVIFNFSSHELSEYEKSLLCKGLNFAIPPKRLDYADHMLPFELLFRDINKSEMPNEDKEFIKSRLKDSAHTSFRSYNYKSEINLTKKEQVALNNLSNNKNIIIQKSDKGNSVVLLDKDKYLEGMYKILNNNAKFEMLQFDHDKELNYVLNLEKKIINVLKDLNKKEEITEVDYIHLYPYGSRPGILYGMAKVHKPVVDRCPSFRPIFSATNTPSYTLAKFLVPLFTPLTSNDYTIKGSFSFARKYLLLIVHII